MFEQKLLLMQKMGHMRELNTQVPNNIYIIQLIISVASTLLFLYRNIITIQAKQTEIITDQTEITKDRDHYDSLILWHV